MGRIVLRTPSPSSNLPTEEEPYKWFPAQTNAQGKYSNQTTLNIVIIGVDFSTNSAVVPSNQDVYFLGVNMPQNSIYIDSVSFQALDYVATPATGEVSFQLELGHKILVPPSAIITTVSRGSPVVTGLSLVACRTLKDALDIL